MFGSFKGWLIDLVTDGDSSGLVLLRLQFLRKKSGSDKYLYLNPVQQNLLAWPTCRWPRCECRGRILMELRVGMGLVKDLRQQRRIHFMRGREHCSGSGSSSSMCPSDA